MNSPSNPIPNGYETFENIFHDLILSKHPTLGENYVQDLVEDASWVHLFKIPGTEIYSIPLAWLGTPDERKIEIVDIYNMVRVHDYGFTIANDFSVDVVCLKKIESDKQCACLVKSVHQCQDKAQSRLDHGIFLFD